VVCDAAVRTKMSNWDFIFLCSSILLHLTYCHPMTFNVLNQFKAYNETTITGRHRSSNVVAPQCVCRCGLRIAFVAFECRRMSSLCAHPRFSCSQCWPQLEPPPEARESVDVLCCTTPGLVWDFNYVALLVELDYQMMLKPQTFNIIW